MRDFRDAVNLPSIGTDDNMAFDSFQLNLAPAVNGAHSKHPS